MLISVIIPVYNAEEYLKECLDSVLNQTYTNLEIILVDDGSLDNSGRICDEYAQSDSRIKVIHKENGGVSVARNSGIDASSGELIVFVDADDYLDEAMIEKLYNALGNNDFSICRFAYEYSDKTVFYQEYNLPLFIKKPYYFEYIMADKYNKAYADRIVCDKIFGSVCRTLFKSETIKNNEIRFLEGVKIAEDRLFLLEYCSYCISAGFVDEYLYHYRAGLAESATAVFNKYQKNLHISQKTLIKRQIELINLNKRLNTKERESLTAYLKFKACYTVTLNEILYNNDNWQKNLKIIFRDNFYKKALKLRYFKHMYKAYNTPVKTLILYLMIKFRMWRLIRQRLCKK